MKSREEKTGRTHQIGTGRSGETHQTGSGTDTAVKTITGRKREAVTRARRGAETATETDTTGIRAAVRSSAAAKTERGSATRAAVIAGTTRKGDVIEGTPRMLTGTVGDTGIADTAGTLGRTGSGSHPPLTADGDTVRTRNAETVRRNAGRRRSGSRRRK